MSITQQVKEAQSGSRAAFGALYESLAGDLYRMALYTLGSRQDAEDAVADTFAEAWKGIKKLREPEAFRSYETAEEASPEIATCRAELHEALGRLAPEERQIVLLSVLEGYTMREIATMLEMPQGTVSSKLSRSLKKLRLQLQDTDGKEAAR